MTWTKFVHHRSTVQKFSSPKGQFLDAPAESTNMYGYLVQLATRLTKITGDCRGDVCLGWDAPCCLVPVSRGFPGDSLMSRDPNLPANCRRLHFTSGLQVPFCCSEISSTYILRRIHCFSAGRMQWAKDWIEPRFMIFCFANNKHQETYQQSAKSKNRQFRHQTLFATQTQTQCNLIVKANVQNLPHPH